VLYAFVLGWPADGKVSIKSLAANNAMYPRKIGSVEMLGVHGRVEFRQEAEALTIKFPAKPQNHLDVYGFRIRA